MVIPLTHHKNGSFTELKVVGISAGMRETVRRERQALSPFAWKS